MWPFDRPELRVLMVCTANVCRSPAAEALLRHHLRELGLAKHVAVSSAGTDVGAPGRKPDPRVVAILTEMGVSTRGLKAQALSERTVRPATHIYVMERAHLDAIAERFPQAASRISLLSSRMEEDIPDPYFSHKAAVHATVDRISELTRGLAEAVRDKAQSWDL